MIEMGYSLGCLFSYSSSDLERLVSLGQNLDSGDSGTFEAGLTLLLPAAWLPLVAYYKIFD